MVRGALFVPALFGAAVSAQLNAVQTVSVGASGGIMGVFAALLLIMPRCEPGKRAGLRNLALQMIGATLLPGLYDEASDLHAHLGGLAAGAIMSRLLLFCWPPSDAYPRRSNWSGLVGFGYLASSTAAFFAFVL